MSYTEPFIDVIATFPEVLKDYLQNESSVKGAVQGHVFLDIEGAGQTLPLIIIEHVSGGERNTNPRREVALTYKITAYAHSRLYAAQIAGFVYNALNTTKLPLPDNWINYWTRGYSWFIDGYRRDNQNIFLAGRFFEFRINETSLPTLRAL